MLAGYETTSTALAYCSFVLATNQEEQNKVRTEIEQQFPAEANVSNLIELRSRLFSINILKSLFIRSRLTQRTSKI